MRDLINLMESDQVLDYNSGRPIHPNMSITMPSVKREIYRIAA